MKQPSRARQKCPPPSHVKVYGKRTHFSIGLSIGNATIALAPAPAVGLGTDLSPPPPTTVSKVRTNGLRLKVWPQLVDGLTGDVGNFTIRIADPICDPEDGCEDIGDEVCAPRHVE